jgi:DNA-directed RNA polymerase subunit RPC12/RpoP
MTIQSLYPCPRCGAPLQRTEAMRLVIWFVTTRGYSEERPQAVRVVACSGCEYLTEERAR